MKKLLMLLICAALIPVAQAATFEELNSEKGAELDALLQNKKPAAAAYKYNYTPSTFIITTEYYRNIYCDMGEDINGCPKKVDLNYKQDGLWGEGAGYFKAKCYGTLINKDYILTHKNCFKLPEMDYEDSDAEGAKVNFEPLNMTFYQNGRELEFDIKDVKQSFIDDKSGAVLINIKDMCFHTKGTTSSDYCVQFWEWMWNSKKEKFNIKKDYGTIILSNILPTDKVEDSFLKRVFFSPLNNALLIEKFSNGVLTSKGRTRESLAGEPLFHRVDANKNILVGIKTSNPSKEGVIKHTKSKDFALFSPNFTNFIKKNIKDGSVKLTKDLNATTSL